MKPTPLTTLSWTDAEPPIVTGVCPDCGQPLFDDDEAEVCTCPQRFAVTISISVTPGPDPPQRAPPGA
jgi:hypothetical protein